MKKLMFGTFVIVGLLGVTSSTRAQDIPPACQIVVDAFRACVDNSVEFLQIEKPDEAEELKRQKVPETISKMIRDSVSQLGEQETAVNCAKKEARQNAFNALSSFVTPLGMVGALKATCASSYQKIAQILQRLD